MRITIPTLLILAAAPLAPAQQAFAQLRQRLEAERMEMVRSKGGAASIEDFTALATRHVARLEEFAAGRSGADAANARLMIADICLHTDRVDAARAALRAIDVASAPGLELLAAAELAQVLEMPDERGRWIDAAMAKPTAFEERMAMGMMLMTRLLEVDRGEGVFRAALAAAEDDEQRARVSWFRADALREREDLEESAYQDALRDLAGRFPETYYGGVAKDRLAARELEPGSPAIPLTGRDLEGRSGSLEQLAGDVVLLDFWSSWFPPGAEVHARLRELHDRFHDRGLRVVGIAVDEDEGAVRAAVRERGLPWPVWFDGKGIATDAALRYGVERVPHHILIGRDGSIAALGLLLESERDVAEAAKAIEAALAKSKD